jgi:hypothetical protein
VARVQNLFQWQSFNGTVWSNVGANNSSYDPGFLSEGNYQYRAMVTQNSGCDAVSGNIIFTVLDYPDASLSSTQASCGDNEGTITVTFTDEQFVTSLVISLNGGASYSAPIPDNQGSATFTDLAPGMYPVWIKWAADECAIFIGDIEGRRITMRYNMR